ncbi:hypothetical protein BT96DRAFT_1014397, partial [Gymnopus androsaceus JB14]
MKSSHVSFASPPETPINYISSGEDDSPSPKSCKRSRDSLDNLYGKLAFNHKISGQYHNLCAEAYDNKLRMKHGIADVEILHGILKLIDSRIVEIQSNATAAISSTPRKRKKPSKKERIPNEHDTEIDSNIRKRSLYRADSDTPRTDSNPPTPFDSMLQRKEMDSPTTPSKKPGACRKNRLQNSPDKTDITSGTTKSEAGPPTVIIIPDDDEEEDVMPKIEVSKVTKKIPELFQLLNDCRREMSVSLARLPQDILPHQTIKQFSEQRPTDYKALQRIIGDTSGIPANTEERDAYVHGKWEEYGRKFLGICIAFNSNRMIEESSVVGTTATFRKTISAHKYTPSDKS